MKSELGNSRSKSTGIDGAKKSFFTANAGANLKKLDDKETEKIVSVKENPPQAEVLTKQESYVSLPESGTVAQNGEYTEYLYKLKKEDGLWKVDDILARRRSADEFKGFVPAWKSGMDEWR